VKKCKKGETRDRGRGEKEDHREKSDSDDRGELGKWELEEKAT